MKVLKIGSVTRTATARDILSKNGIKASVRKLTQYEGCVNALVVSTGEQERAIRILSEKGIKATPIQL